MHQACLGSRVLRLCEYIIRNSRNVLVFKTIYTEINNQKKPKLQLFLLGALQDSILQDFVKPILTLMRCFVFPPPPPQTGAMSTAKLNKSLGSGYRESKRE